MSWLAHRGRRRAPTPAYDPPDNQWGHEDQQQVYHLRSELITRQARPSPGKDKVLQQIAGLPGDRPGLNPAKGLTRWLQCQQRQQPEDIPGLEPLGANDEIPGKDPKASRPQVTAIAPDLPHLPQEPDGEYGATHHTDGWPDYLNRPPLAERMRQDGKRCRVQKLFSNRDIGERLRSFPIRCIGDHDQHHGDEPDLKCEPNAG